MNKFRFITVLFLLIIILGTSSSNTIAQESAPVILIFNGDISVMREKPTALLVQNLTLLESNRQVLIKAAAQSVILYEGPMDQLIETFGIDNAASVRTETTTAWVSAFYIRNGKPFVSQLLVPNNNLGQDRAQAYTDFVNLILASADKYAGPLKVAREYISYANNVFIPVVSVARNIAYWDPMPILINSIIDCPWGKYNDVVIGQQVAGENNPNRDYWGTEIMQQILPGNDACNEGGSWYNEKVWNMVDLLNWNSAMYRYGPFSTFGEQTAEVSIGFNEGGFSLGWSWTFPVVDVNVYDHSDFGFPRMSHELELGGNAALYTYTSEPGLSVTLDQDVRPLFYRPINLYWHHWLYQTHYLWDNWFIEY